MSEKKQTFSTDIRPYGKAAIDAAAGWIARGQPVAVPTETVYGLAADATNGEAVARIYAAKGRPSFNPLIVHVRDLDHARELGDFCPAAAAVAGRWWPGPLTLVVPRRADAPLADLATAGLPSVALRCPAHPAMRDLIAASGKPLAAPSANASGTISPTSALHVQKTLAGRIPLIIDGGDTEHGLESTIVAFTGGEARLLRPGPIAFEDILEVAGLPAGAESGRIEAPGQLDSHYAPDKPVRLNATERQDGEWLIGFGSITGNATLSAGGDLVEAAARLFGALHDAEEASPPRIAVAPIPEQELGTAINDRLRRAAAPR